MSNIAAIDIGEDEAIVIAANCIDNSSIELTEYFRIPVENLTHLKNEETESQEDEQSSESEKLTKAPQVSFSKTEQGILVREFLATDVESSLALINTNDIMYREIQTPFDDTKKIDKIAPLQIQDQIPLDIEDYFLDSLVVGKKPNGTFDVMTSLVPTNTITQTIDALHEIGTDPKTITTKASAISAITEFFPDQLSGSFVIIEVSRNKASIVVFLKDELVKLRDIAFACDKDGLLKKTSLQEINCLIMGAEDRSSIAINTAFIISNQSIFEQCQGAFKMTVRALDISSKVINKTNEDIKVEDISWAIGLAASELKTSKTGIIDFRTGPFAHKHIWKNLKLAFKEELFFIILAIVFCLGWLFSLTYGANSDLNTIENQIKKTTDLYLPGEVLPFRREVSTLETDVEELEEQLRGMGSLSSLPPLETLKEISDVIPKSIGIEIDVLNIAETKLSFRGSVADTPSVGRLSSVLEQNNKRFCEVKVDPKGKLRGSSRVRFSAEIRLCQ